MFADLSLAKSAHMAKPTANVGRDTQGRHNDKGPFITVILSNTCWNVTLLFGNNFYPPNSKLKFTELSISMAHFMLSEIFSGMPEGFPIHSAQGKFLSHSPSFPLLLTRTEVVSRYLFSIVAVTNDHK